MERARAVVEAGCLRDLPAWVASVGAEDPDWVTSHDDADERLAESVADALLAVPPPGADPPDDPEPRDEVPDRPHVEIPEAFRPQGGRPLPDAVRRWAEPATGRDLSQVRVHDSPSAQRQADAMHAHAYTLGRDIVLGSAVGRVETALTDPVGRHTIAHEIGHVVAPPRGGRVGRDESEKPVDKSTTWRPYVPPQDVEKVIGEVRAYMETLGGVEWDKTVRDAFGEEEVANGTPAQVLEPVSITILCDNYEIVVDGKGSVMSVRPQEEAKLPPGDATGIALAYPALGLVWQVGVQTRADKSQALLLRPTAKRPAVTGATPGQSFLVVYLPGVSAPQELIDKLRRPKSNTSDTPGWTKDQLAQIKKRKAQKAAQKSSEPPPGSKEGSEQGEGKGDTGEGKGAGHGQGEGIGDGTGPGEQGGGGEAPAAEKEDPLRGPVKYSSWQGEKGPPQLVMEIDRAWTSVPLKEGESTEDLEARADAALTALQASRDPANSTRIEKGVTETGIVQPKGSTEGVMQTKAQAEAQASSTPTHATPGEMGTPGKGGIANAPEYPSKIIMTGRDERFPAVTTSGATNEFTMDVNYAARSMGTMDEVFNRMQRIQFYWEVIDVTGLTVAKAKEMSEGEDKKRQEEAEKLAAQTAIGKGEQETSLGATGTNLERDLDAIAEDQANDIEMMSEEDWPWEARAAYLGVIGISNVIRTIGSIVGSFIDVLTQPLDAQSIGFDHDGDYIVRCVATPVVSDEAREDPDHHVIRKSSISVLPIRVSQVKARAVEALNREDDVIAAKERKLEEAKAKGEQWAIDNAQAEVDALKKAKGRSASEEFRTRVDYLRDQVRVAESLQKRRTAPLPTTPAGEKHSPYADWDDAEVDLAFRLHGMGKPLQAYLQEMKTALEQMTKSGHAAWVKEHATFEPVGSVKAEFRPRLVLASEVTGQVTDVLCMLGQVSKGDNAPWKWKLVDITSPGSRDEYVGTSSKPGEEGRAEAIRDCFRRFAEKSGYGRGTLAIRLSDDLRAAVPTASVEATMRSAPGGADRGLSRLGDLAKAAMIAGLFVTGPAGLVIGAVGGVAGAVVAANSLVKRARTGHLLEIGTVFDALGVIGSAAAFLNSGVALIRGSAEWSKRLQNAPKWLSRLEKLENRLHIYGKFDNVQQLFSIPVQLAVEWHEIEESGGSEGQKRSRKMKALLHAIETGAITVTMMGGGLRAKDEHAVNPPDSTAPLPKGTGEADAHARADGTGPAKPPTVHPDEGKGAAQSEESAPPAKPITPDDAKALAKSKLEATAQAERKAAHDKTDATSKPKGDEKVTPDEDSRTTTGTAKPTPERPFEPIADKNVAEKQKVVETLQGRLGKEVAQPSSQGKPAPQGEYGARTMNSKEAVENYDKAVAESAGREVGLFFNPNTGEFQVMVGTENSVRGPRGDGWQALVHLHPNPENVITLRLPAPADVWGAVKAAMRTGSHTEFVQSTRPDGSTGLAKVTVTTPPLKILVELPASPGEPARTIVAKTPDEYVAEYGRDSSYMEPGSDLYNWVMRDLDDYYDLKRKDADERTAAGVAGKPTQTEPGPAEQKGAHSKAIEALRREVLRQQEQADPATKKMYDDVLADLAKLADDDAAGTLPSEVRKRIKEKQDDLAQYHDKFKPVPLHAVESKAQRMRTEASETKKSDLKPKLIDLATRFDKLAEKIKKNPKFDPRLEYAALVSEWAGLRAREGDVVFDLRDPVLRKQTVDWFTANAAKLTTDSIGELVLKRLVEHLGSTDLLVLGQSPRSAARGQGLESDLQGAVKAAVKGGRFPDWYLAEFAKGVDRGREDGRTDGWPNDEVGVAWEVDHVIELWLSGADDVSNFLAIPKRVHNDKNAMMAKFRAEYRARAVAGESTDVRATDPREQGQ